MSGVNRKPQVRPATGRVAQCFEWGSFTRIVRVSPGMELDRGHAEFSCLFDGRTPDKYGWLELVG
jgi:hypothetical protein